MRHVFTWAIVAFALLIAWGLIVKPITAWRRARNNGKPRPPWGFSRAEVAEFELEQQILAGIKPPPPPPAPPRPVRAHERPPLDKPLDVECPTDRFAKHEDARLLLIERAARAFVYGCSVEPENEDDVGDDRPMLPALKTAYDVKLWRELERAIACPAGWTPQERARIDALMAAVDMEVVKAAPIGTQFVTLRAEEVDALRDTLDDVGTVFDVIDRDPERIPMLAKDPPLARVLDMLRASMHRARARTELSGEPQAVDAARPTDKEFKP